MEKIPTMVFFSPHVEQNEDQQHQPQENEIEQLKGKILS